MTANAIDLTWLSVVKSRAGIQSSGQDAEIQAAITGFSQWLLNWTGVPTLNSVASVTEIYDGNGNNELFLRGRPVLTVTALVASGVSALPGIYVESSKKSIAMQQINNPGINTFASLGISRGGNGGPVFPLGKGNIMVSYTCGYPPTTISDEMDTVTGQAVTPQVQPWDADVQVVFFPSLTPLVKVDSNPSAGQYAVTSSGLYTFNVANEGAKVLLTYTASLAPSDLELAVRNIVAINAIRKGTLDLATRGMTAQATNATTAYRNWTWPPEYQQILTNYQRKSLT